MNEKTDRKIKWGIVFTLISVIFVLTTSSLVWDYYSQGFEEENEGDLGRLGYLPIESTASPPKNITIRNINWIDYLENPDNYDIDLLIVGDSFSSAGGLPQYLATKNDIQVLAIRVKEVQSLQERKIPINLLIALDNGGIVDMINPDCILLESVPRLMYQQTKDVDFTSKITPEQLKRVFAVNSTSGIPSQLNLSGYTPVKGYRGNTSQKSLDAGMEIQAILADLFSEKSRTWQDPVQVYFNDITERIIKIRQMIVSVIWLHIYGHSYEIPGQPAITYRFYVNEPLFSSKRNPDSLYVISGDLEYLNHLNESGWIYQHNLYLNTLEHRFAEKNITFYFMPAIDKFDFYYPRIKNNPYPCNTFFSDFEGMDKAYNYINSKQILEKKLNSNDKDIFWLGDTHWSWIAVEYLSSEISPLEVSEPEKFSLKESIERLPADPEILNAYAVALANTGEYRYASQLRIKAFETETGMSVLDIKLEPSSLKLNDGQTFGTVQKFLNQNEYLEISGWAVDPVQKKPGRFVLITDNDQNIITVSMIDQQKPGIASRFNNEEMLISGWTAQIDNNDITNESFPFNAYIIGSENPVGYLIPYSKGAEDLMMNYSTKIPGHSHPVSAS